MEKENTLYKILLVEDTVSTIDFVCKSLQEKGYQVFVAETGEKAILSASRIEVNLILLDTKLPDMDGFEVCRKLQADSKTKDIPIIFMSDMDAAFDKVRGFNLGGVDYIVKPIETEELLSRVRTHITLRRLYEEKENANALLEESVLKRTLELHLSNQRLKKEIEERKKIEENKKRLEDQLHQARRMEALGTLASGIAHDFNNILTTIILHTDLAILDTRKGVLAGPRLDKVMAASNRASELVRQIMIFGRENKLPNKLFKLGPMMEEICNLLKDTVPSSIEIVHDIKDADGFVIANPTQMRQALMNLCNNAIHAVQGKKKSFVKLTLERVDFKDGEIPFHFPNLNPGSYARFSIEDNGYGIDKKTMDRIFEPYFSTKKPEEGTGLGMAVVHGIIKSCNGEIQVQSELNKGSIITLFFPRTEFKGSLPKLVTQHVQGRQKGRPEDGTSHGEAEPGAGSKKIFPPENIQVEAVIDMNDHGQGQILVMDDEEMILELLTDILETMGFSTITTSEGKEALAAFKKASRLNNPFSAVILDLSIPGKMGGLETVGEIRKLDKDIPVFVATGFSDDEVIKDPEAFGFTAGFKKPFAIAQIALMFEKYLL